MPNALLEAMAAGLPCVATDIPACREVIRDGVNGLLVRKESSASIAQGILRVIGDTIRAGRLGETAAQEMLKCFDPATWLRKWEEHYAHLADTS
jgi:glycosyltransferase involved in cell wall biosynthesis